MARPQSLLNSAAPGSCWKLTISLPVRPDSGSFVSSDKISTWCNVAANVGNATPLSEA